MSRSHTARPLIGVALPGLLVLSSTADALAGGGGTYRPEASLLGAAIGLFGAIFMGAMEMTMGRHRQALRYVLGGLCCLFLWPSVPSTSASGQQRDRAGLS